MCIFAAENLILFGLCHQAVTVLASGCPDKSHYDPETVMEGDCSACLHLGSEPFDLSESSYPKSHALIKYYNVETDWTEYTLNFMIAPEFCKLLVHCCGS